MKKFTVIYQDVHCYKSLRIKSFDTLKEAKAFVESDDVCPEGERVECVIVESAKKVIEHKVDAT